MGLFSGLLGQETTIEPWLAESATGFKGAGSYGTSVPLTGRVEIKTRRVVGDDGKDRVSGGRVIYEGDITVDVRSRLTLPTNYNPRQPPIISIEKPPGIFGHVTETVVNF